MNEWREIVVMVAVTKSGYIDHKIVEERPPAHFVGKLVTRYHNVQIITHEKFDETTKFAIMGRVAKWLVKEEII